MNQWRGAPGVWGGSQNQDSGPSDGQFANQHQKGRHMNQNLGKQNNQFAGQKLQNFGQDQGGSSGANNNQQKKGRNVGKIKQPLNKPDDTTATEYADVICYSCGEPGHHETQCPNPPACFICKVVTHRVKDCPVRKKPRNPAKFVGSGAPGLGYHQIDVPDVNDRSLVKKGDISNAFLVVVISSAVYP